MKDFFVGLFVLLLGMIATFGIVWILTGNQLLLSSYFSPKFEQVRRETFETSKAYNDGMAKELESMRFQYETADEAHKDALGSLIRHRVAGYDTSNLSQEMRTFISSLSSNSTPKTEKDFR